MVQWIGTCTDIAAHKQALVRIDQALLLLRENNAQLIRANVDLDAFVYTASAAHLEIDIAACPAVAFLKRNLRSVIFNLLSNALKYRHSARLPHVRLACRPAGTGLVVLTVQDNGLGFDLAQRPRLFALFERLHDHVEGSGSGLYMVKKVVENAGGRIEMASELGVGTTFSVYLPN